MVDVKIVNRDENFLKLYEDDLTHFYKNNSNDIILASEDDVKCYFRVIDYNYTKNKISVLLSCESIFCDNISYKTKYDKVIYHEKSKNTLINNIGLINAQKAHAVEIQEEYYEKIEDFLKHSKLEFNKIALYQKDFYDEYNLFRHKNLFSKYSDEISDFERITYLSLNDENRYKFSHTLDEKILEYDDSKADLVSRKNARNLAKAIYHDNAGMTKNEVLILLKDSNIYVRRINIIAPDQKGAWNNINVDDMNYFTLSNYFTKNNESKKLDKEKYYSSKRTKNKKSRYTKYKQIKFGVDTYNIE